MDNACQTLERFLSIAARHVLSHPVEDLLNINPDIPGADGVGLASFKVFCYNTIDLLIIAAKNFRNVSILRLNVKDRPALDVVQQLLANCHPVLLRSVSSLIAHGNEATRHKWFPSHHDHEVCEWLKSVVLICAQPNIKRRILGENGMSHPNPAHRPVDVFLDALPPKCDEIVGRIL